MSERREGGSRDAEPIAALADEFLSLWRRGERPAIEEFAARIPERAAEIREALSAIVMIEGAAKEGDDSFRPPLDGLHDLHIVRELGRGGMGVVYEAWQEALERRVAIKVLGPGAATSVAGRERFRREAAAASRLEHPDICTVYAAAFDDEPPHIVMQLVEGETLADCIARSRRRDPTGHVALPQGDTDGLSVVIGLIERVARALHVAHEAGVVHRDMKPGNVMVTPTGSPVILDFGLAGLENDGDPTLTRTGEILGTLAYMSPEQVEGRSVDRAADVYALGAILYECATLRRPHETSTRAELVRAVVESSPPDPRTRNPAISKDLAVVIERSLERLPEHRYVSALAFADDLRRLREGRPVAARPVSAARRLARWSRRRPALASLLVVSVVAAALAGYLGARYPELREHAALVERESVEARLAHAFHLLHHGRPGEGRERLEGILADHGECAEALAGIAFDLLFVRGDPAGALARLEEGTRFEAEMPALRILRAEAMRRLGREGERREVLSEPVRARTAFGMALGGHRALHRGHVEHEARHYEVAAACFGQAIILSERPRRLYHYGYAHALGHLPGDERGRWAAEAVTRLWPGDALAWTWAGFAATASVPGQAEAYYRRALELDDGIRMVRFNLALRLEERGALEEALRLLVSCVELDPGNASYRLHHGRILLRLERHDEAARVLHEAFELSPDDVGILVSLGTAERRSGRPERARVHLTRASELEPENARIQFNLGLVLLDTRCFAKAVERFRKARAAGDDSWALRRNLGRALAGSGAADEAVRMFEEAAREEPGCAEAHHALGVVLSDEKRDYARAITCFERVLELDADHPDVRRSLGLTLLKRGRTNEAVAVLEEAAARRPSDARTLSGLGAAYIRVERHELAEQVLERSVELRPDDPGTRVNLGRARRFRGRLRESLESYRAAHELWVARDGAHEVSAGWVAEAEELVALEEELLGPDVAAVAVGSRVRLRKLMRVARWTRRHAASAGLAEMLLEGEEDTAARRVPTMRLAAAVSAALAGLGQGRDSADLDTATRRRWRIRARTWIEDEVDAWEDAFAAGTLHRDGLRRVLARLVDEPRFDAMRDPPSLDRLPADEQAAWRRLWLDVEELAESLEP